MGNISEKLTYLLATKEAIKDAIVAKGGEVAEDTPFRGYAECISELPLSGGGEGLPDDLRVLTGSCRYKFYCNAWNDFLEKYGSQISTQDLTDTYYMFGASSDLTEVPFELNYDSSVAANVGYMFYNAEKLTEIPKFNNCKPNNVSHIFNGCRRIKEYPEDMDTWFDWSYIDNATSNITMAYIFNNNNSLRKAPVEFLKHGNVKTSYNSAIYYYCFSACYLLDEVIGLPIEMYTGVTWTSNAFNSTFSGCYRLKDVVFETQADGTPYTVKWKGQTITANSNFGWASSSTYVAQYGITSDKLVKDDATYQALKNDPDWYAISADYSRYNHDSAVNTINSLPDTSAYLTTAGGTNTVKFKGTAGAKTDGGAINTLTAEEIAVATAKGWTISFT